MADKNKKLKVFLVEDSTLYSLMLDHKLQDIADYRLTVFETAEEALDNLYLKPDCVILDYFLPGMNGLEALKKIKTQHPNLPVIILSSQNNVQVALDVIKAGATEYFTKGNLNIDDLYETINRSCENKK
jgi:DNA-binding NtrC family response regulator